MNSSIAEPEEITLNQENTIIAVNRGRKGAMLVNITDKEITTTLATTLPDGKYTDAVHGTTFRVKKGILTGTFAPTSSYALYTK